MELYNESNEGIYKYDYKKLLFLLASPCSSCRWTNSIITIIVTGWHWGVYAEQFSKLNTKWLSSLLLLLLAIKQNTERCIPQTSDEWSTQNQERTYYLTERRWFVLCRFTSTDHSVICIAMIKGGPYLCPSPAIFQGKPNRVNPRQKSSWGIGWVFVAIFYGGRGTI